MKIITSSFIASIMLTSSFTCLAQEGDGELPTKLKIDFDKSGPVAVALDFKRSETDELKTLSVTIDGKTFPINLEDIPAYSAGLEAHTISSDKGTKALLVTSVGDSDFNSWTVFTKKDGQIQQAGVIEAQGEIRFPGNGSIVSDGWMGFWNKVEKYVFDSQLKLTKIPQEFYAVNVEGTVSKSFPVYQKRDEATVLANTKVGSKFKVLLWDPSSHKPEIEENWTKEWYLIQTESGFTGWVRLSSLQHESAELPWAG